MTLPSRAAVARALYETDSGHNGYPPLHLTIPWAELTFRDAYYEHADELLRALPTNPATGLPVVPATNTPSAKP